MPRSFFPTPCFPSVVLLQLLLASSRPGEAQITERVSVSSTGVQANHSSWSPSLSADGRFVAFTSGADNLVPGDTNGRWDICPHAYRW